MKMKKKRFSVSLPIDDYQKLVRLAEGTKPRLTFRLLVNVAIHKLLEQSEDPHLSSELWNPFGKKKKNEN
jgi:hypothetical protein